MSVIIKFPRISIQIIEREIVWDAYSVIKSFYNIFYVACVKVSVLFICFVYIYNIALCYIVLYYIYDVFYTTFYETTKIRVCIKIQLQQNFFLLLKFFRILLLYGKTIVNAFCVKIYIPKNWLSVSIALLSQ